MNADTIIFHTLIDYLKKQLKSLHQTIEKKLCHPMTIFFYKI
jgi:hypothetical protein